MIAAPRFPCPWSNFSPVLLVPQVMKRWFTAKRLAILSVIYLALCAVGGVLLVEISLHPPTLRPVNAAAFARASELAQGFGGSIEAIEQTDGDGTHLKAWLMRPATERANGHGVLLLHGVSDSRVGVLGFAPFLLENGYTLLLPDARAHGESGGLATYGLLERYDVRRWADALRTKLPARETGAAACVYGLGASMGAAMLLQSLEKDSHDFCAVTVDSPFAEFKEVAFDRVAQPFGAGPWLGKTLLRPLVEIAFLYAKARYGYSFQNASPMHALDGSQVPVLLIHGEQDYNIPIRHALALKAAHPAINYWPVPGATHTAAHGVATAEYERRVLNWFAAPPPAASRAASASTPAVPGQSTARPVASR